MSSSAVIDCPMTPEHVEQCPATPELHLDDTNGVNVSGPSRFSHHPTRSEPLSTLAQNLQRTRSDSPPPTCAICLGICFNKCFTDNCCHNFCFTCLLEWSKVK